MRKVLSNGVRVVYDYMPWVKSLTVGVWIKTGSRNENIKNNGVAHFIEHMLFKGTEKRSAVQIANEIDYIGGSINAFTSKEYTCYYTKTLDEHIDIAIDVLSDIILNSVFDEKEIEKERGVILEEINMYEDSPEDLSYEILMGKVWDGSSLGFNIAGTKESVSNLKREDIIQYKNQNYTTNNIVISVAGNFKEAELIEKLEGAFAGIQEKGIENSYGKEVYVPGFTFKKKEIEQCNVCVGLDGLGYGHKHLYPLMLANNMFGGTMSSILFQNIREEKGLCYTIYSSLAPYINAGNVYIYAGTGVQQADALIEGIFEEIKKFNSEVMTEEILNRNKQQVKGNLLLSYESTGTRMSAMGKNEIIENKVITQEDVLKKIEAVTLEEVCEVVNYIFDQSKLSLAVVTNSDNEEHFKNLYENLKK